MPQAKVTSIEHGTVYVRVRRNYRDEKLVTWHLEQVPTLEVGDKVEVTRKVNSPYPYLLQKLL